MLTLKERIDAGEMVALLADRVGLGDRVVEVDLFGAPALLPAGPYWLAASLRCPVYLTFGLYHEPNRYDLYCEPFAERIELPRGDARKRGARLGAALRRSGWSTTAGWRPTTGSTSTTVWKVPA